MEEAEQVIFSRQVRAYHEFEADEVSRGEPVVEVLEERAFQKMERTSDYVFSLPEDADSMAAYPWDDTRWRGDWLHHRGGIGRAEAHFWLMALSHPERLTDTRANFKAPRQLRRLRSSDVHDFTLGDARARLSAWFEALSARRAPLRWFCFSYFTRFLTVLFPVHQVIDLLFELIPPEEVRHFFSHLFAPEDPVQRALAVEAVSARLRPLTYEDTDSIYTGIRLLERIPVAHEAERLVAALQALPQAPDTLVRDAVNLLHDPMTFAAWFERLPTYRLAPEEVPFLVLRGGMDVVPALMKRVLEQDTAFLMIAIKDLLRIHDKRAVEGFLALCDSSAFAPISHGWMMDEGANAITGLLPIATTRHRHAHIAQRILCEMRDRGHMDLIQELLQEHHDEVTRERAAVFLSEGVGLRDALPEDEQPDWMQELAKDELSRHFPDYIDVTMLPGLVSAHSEHVLPQRVVLGVLSKLRSTKPDELDPVLLKLRAFLTPKSRDEFASHLFTLWQQQGFPSKHKFILWSIGWLDAQSMAVRLLPLIDEWGNARQLKRAEWGMDVFAIMNSEESLTLLHRLSHKLRQKSLRLRADEALDRCASRRGITREELNDHIVPTCGLDEHGRRVFDFGARTFVATLDAELKPILEDEEGKLHTSIPARRQSDDAVLVARARERWKLFTKQIAEALKVEKVRLEQAMISGRQWDAQTFQGLLLHHPLLGTLCAKVLWGVFDESRGLGATFRVSQERELLGWDDEPFALPAGARVGIVHPVSLEDAALKRWGEVFADYEINPLFAQLTRPLSRDLSMDTVMAFQGAQVEAKLLRGRLTACGWDAVHTRRTITRFVRSFPMLYPQALAGEAPSLWVISLELSPGMSTDWQAEQPAQTLRLVSVRAEQGEKAWAVSAGSEVEACVLSEMVHDLQQVVDRSA